LSDVIVHLRVQRTCSDTLGLLLHLHSCYFQKTNLMLQRHKITLFAILNVILTFLQHFNRICCVMVSVLASISIDCGFKPRSGQTKDCEISICCFSAKHAAILNCLNSSKIQFKNQSNRGKMDTQNTYESFHTKGDKYDQCL
jgi:hypothetical protein